MTLVSEMLFVAEKIWRSFEDSSVLTDRARFFWDSCSDILRRINVKTYLDIGTGRGYNAEVFGSTAKATVCLDLKILSDNIQKRNKTALLVSGDALNLPLKQVTFDTVSLFSVIEYVANPQQLLEEAFRVVKSKGIVIIQMPNRFFPIDPHNGVPLLFMFPKTLRNHILKVIFRQDVKYRETPSLKQLLLTIKKIDPQSKVVVRKIHFPSSVIIPNLRKTYDILSTLGLLDLFPIGYILMWQK